MRERRRATRRSPMRRIDVLRDALSGAAPVDRILLKAAAGAGKSFVLRRLVGDAVEHPSCTRVAIVAFTNKQIHPLATSLGKTLGKDRVCLFVAKDKFGDVPDDAQVHATVVTTATSIPPGAEVIISTCHKLGAIGELKRLKRAPRRRARRWIARSTSCSSTRRGSFPTTCSTRSPRQLRSRSGSAMSGSSRHWRSAQTRGGATRGSTPTARGRPRSRATSAPGRSSSPRSGGLRRVTSAFGGPSTPSGANSTASLRRVTGRSSPPDCPGRRPPSGSRSAPAYRRCWKSRACRTPKPRTSTCR